MLDEVTGVLFFLSPEDPGCLVAFLAALMLLS
jgi:hypothetical protein